MLLAIGRVFGLATAALLLLGTATRPALGQSYTATPTIIGEDCDQLTTGTIFCYSGVVAGLPSVSTNGASVTFHLAWTVASYQGQGEINVQYMSDDQPAWATIGSVTSQNGGVTEPGTAFTTAVSVSNLSTLKFREQLVASAGGPGSVYAFVSGDLSNISVTP